MDLTNVLCALEQSKGYAARPGDVTRVKAALLPPSYVKLDTLTH
jgi:hypothetical protein